MARIRTSRQPRSRSPGTALRLGERSLLTREERARVEPQSLPTLASRNRAQQPLAKDPAGHPAGTRSRTRGRPVAAHGEAKARQHHAKSYGVYSSNALTPIIRCKMSNHMDSFRIQFGHVAVHASCESVQGPETCCLHQGLRPRVLGLRHKLSCRCFNGLHRKLSLCTPQAAEQINFP